MQNLDLSFASDPNTLVLALAAGLVPAILWIFFWVREDRERPRRAGALFFAFLGGVFMVILALPVERFMLAFSSDIRTLTVLWAASEEALKFGAFLLILSFSSSIEVPIDYPVYLMIIALGFAGFENALYFLHPIQTGTATALALAGSMRFLGSTLMHAAASSLAGIGLGFAYFGSRRAKVFAALGGLAIAAALHGLFNLFIPEVPDMVFLAIIASLWLLTVIIMVLLEKLRARGSADYLKAHRLAIINGHEAALGGILARSGMTPADMDPVLAGLTKLGVPPGDPVHAALSGLVAETRKLYATHLVHEGAKKIEAAQTAARLIPETVSPRALSGIFAALKA